MNLLIMTSDLVVFDGVVDKVTLPGSLGNFQVLRNHAFMITTLERGDLMYSINSIESIFAINGGFMNVKDNKIVILTH